MKFTTVLFFAAFVTLHFHVHSQDLIFRKNGEVISAKILEKTNRYCSYQLAGQSDTLTRFISVSAIDSIAYHDGRHEVIRVVPVSSVLKEIDSLEIRKTTSIPHNMMGVDVFGLLYRNIRFSYEFLPGKARLGYKLSCGFNLEENLYFEEYLSPRRRTKWLGEAGVNYYFFPPGSFRIGTGLNFITGSGNTYVYNVNTNLSDTVKKNVNGITLCFALYYRISKDVALNLATDIPLISNLNRTSLFVSMELLICF